jgi:methylated-DNA-[protein]-cysteine S-methyltransferase
MQTAAIIVTSAAYAAERRGGLEGKRVTLVFRYVPSPVGRLKLVASDSGLVAILWPEDDPNRVRLGDMVECADDSVLAETQRQLVDYFAGRRQQFTVPLDLRGTDFQKQVWTALLPIPFGQTRSYGQIASGIGRPSAARAVGAANGRNPISIVAPCHRVLGADGALIGFAGGLAAKEYLLRHERRHAAA